MVRLVHDLGCLGEHLGRWSEGCPCHSSILASGSRVACQLKGCRAPEFASGSALEEVQEKFRVAGLNFVAHSSSLMESQRISLLNDFDRAKSKIVSEITVKIGYWRTLPHALCGLGHFDAAQAQASAAHVLRLWTKQTPGCNHLMSRRFLDPQFSGLRGDEHPLRQHVL